MAQSIIDYVNQEYQDNQKRFQEKVKPFTEFLKAGYDAKLKQEEETKVREQGLRDIQYLASQYGDEFTPTENVTVATQKEGYKLKKKRQQAQTDELKKWQDKNTESGLSADGSLQVLKERYRQFKAKKTPEKDDSEIYTYEGNIYKIDKKSGKIETLKEKETSKKLSDKQKARLKKHIDDISETEERNNKLASDMNELKDRLSEATVNGDKKVMVTFEGYQPQEYTQEQLKHQMKIVGNELQSNQKKIDKLNKKIDKLGVSRESEDNIDDKIDMFMKANNITDRDEAIRILKENKVI